MSSQPTNPTIQRVNPFWPGLLILILVAVILRAYLLTSFPLSPDEGIHLMWLRLLSAGYQPYTEVYITYPPLYPLMINAVWQLWPSEAAQRWFSVLYMVFGTVGIALLARRLAGDLAGLAAAFLTLSSPVLVEPSRAILAEFPSVAWSVWAIWLAWLAGDEIGHSTPRRRILLILSGLCLSASLLTKLLSPFVALLIPLILFARWFYSQNFSRLLVSSPHASRLTPLLTDLFIWGLALLLPAFILISAFNVESLAQQVVAQRLGARAAATEAEAFWPPRYERSMMFVQEDTVLVVLGLLGLGTAWARRQPGRWLLLGWLGLALAMLAFHNPIRYKHFLILIPPLAILGGLTIYDLGFTIYDLIISPKSTPERAVQNPRPKGQSKMVAGIGFLLFLGLYAWQIPAAITIFQAKAAVPQPPPDEVEALAFIENVTAPGDCLISDDMPLLYWSGRIAPPQLAEVSTNRLESGALTTAELIAISDQADCQLVAAVSNRITQYLPDYMDWVKQNYLGRFHYGEDDLYFAKITTDPRPATPLAADFDGQILFHGYTLPGEASPGERIPLTLVWQAQTAPVEDYAIFVQLRDAANNTLASADHQPYQGLVPTSSWPAGAVVQEFVWLSLPADLPPGSYNLYVGLYRPDTLERLPLQGDASGENALILGPLVAP